MNEEILRVILEEGEWYKKYKKEIPFNAIDFRTEDKERLTEICKVYNVRILKERQIIKISKKKISREDYDILKTRLEDSIRLEDFFQGTHYSFINTGDKFNFYKGEIEAVWKTNNKKCSLRNGKLRFVDIPIKELEDKKLVVKRSDEVNQIILNRMFAGSYIDDGETIGHETINTFIADDGNCYIYLNSEGTINQERTEYSGKISEMLLVKSYQTNVWEIIGVVKDIHTIEEMVITDDNRCWPRWYRYERFIEKYENVSYGGVTLKSIQENNRYNNVLTRDPFATCTGKLYNLREPYFIVNTNPNDNFDDSDYYCKVKKGLSKESLRMFFDKKDHPLFELINSQRFKDNLVESTNRVDLSNTTDYINESIFDVLGIQYYELAYSNIISHYLSNNEYCKTFIKDVLKLEEDYYNDNYKVVREEHNVDILLKGDNHIIVIENKIKSDINGRNITKEKILKDIFMKDEPEEIEALKQELTEEPVGDYRISQLCKYWYYAQYVAAKNGIDENNIKGFVLIPNYQSAIITESSIEREFKGDMYQLIKYRELYEMSKNITGDVRDSYYEQYLLGVERQSKDTDNYKQAREMNKFINRIKKCINDQNHSSENE